MPAISICKNNRAGFDWFYDKYAPIIYGMLLQLSANDIKASEIMMKQVFVELFSADTFNTQTNYFPDIIRAVTFVSVSNGYGIISRGHLSPARLIQQ